MEVLAMTTLKNLLFALVPPLFALSLLVAAPSASAAECKCDCPHPIDTMSDKEFFELYLNG